MILKSFGQSAGWPEELWQSLPKCSPTNFLPKLIHNWYYGKRSPRIRATSVIFNQLGKENHCPLGKNSPDMVTLPVSPSQRGKWFKYSSEAR
jgi:hypothetical protein